MVTLTILCENSTGTGSGFDCWFVVVVVVDDEAVGVVADFLKPDRCGIQHLRPLPRRMEAVGSSVTGKSREP